MKCFVCKDTRWTYRTQSRGGVTTLRAEDCAHCTKHAHFFLTQPQLRQNTKGFEELVSKKGIEFTTLDKFSQTTAAIELNSEPKMSNLYLWNYNTTEDTKSKSVRGSGEVIFVSGQYLIEFVTKKMIEWQTYEIKNCKWLTAEQKAKAISLLRLRVVTTNIGYNAQTIFA